MQLRQARALHSGSPIDPKSLASAEEIDWKWYQNKAFMNRLGATLAPSEVNPDDYAAIYFVGGPGGVWDFPDDEEFQALSRRNLRTRPRKWLQLLMCRPEFNGHISPKPHREFRQ